ncbi:MAG: ImmA/IrrE family metallo-endopeptidase [Lachnospiraceae bacterium]|nr:ImmA/IrrE family metallo-endopeptidase [Lachnospiraceae bacterium]
MNEFVTASESRYVTAHEIFNINIQPAVINWALSQTKEEQLGIKLMDNIRRWLDGSKTPTFNQIEDFSRKANIPLGYFFLQTPPVEEIKLLEYRTVDSIELANPSRNLIDTIYEMENVQDWMRDYRQDADFDVLTFVGSLKGKTDVKAIADQIRADLDMQIDWYDHKGTISEAFNYVRGLLEYSGVLVMLNGIVGKNTHRALSVDEFRAFAMVDEWAPLIFINSADSEGAKLFSLFHELVHIWIGENDLYNDRRNSKNVKDIEILCNAVASELMVPQDAFLEAWKDNTTTDLNQKINDITKRFKCSVAVIARKALDNKKINQRMYDEIVEKAIEAYRKMKESKESGGGNYYYTMGARLDSAFVKAICFSIKSGRTSYTEAYRLTNTSRMDWQC